MSLSRKSTVGSQEDLKMAGDLQVVRGGAGGRAPACWPRLGWLELAAVLKEGVPGHSHQLAQTWGRRGEGVVGFAGCLHQK